MYGLYILSFKRDDPAVKLAGAGADLLILLFSTTGQHYELLESETLNCLEIAVKYFWL